MTSVATVTMAYVAGLSVSLAMAVVLGGAPSPSLWAVGACIVPLAVPLALTTTHRPEQARVVWQAAWALVTCGVLVLAATARLPALGYGDGDIFEQFVAQGMVVPRWLAGSALAAWGYAAAWEFPPLAAQLPASLSSASGYLSVVCALATGLGTLALLRRWPTSLAVLLPTLTPVWLLFASGYVEYYPLIAPLYVATLAWLFDEPLAVRSPRHLGAVVGALPFVYLGFAPLALMTLAAYGVARRSRLLDAIGTASLTAALTIAVCWPQGVPSYFRSLYSVMNFGDASLPERYAGMVGGDVSIFFAPRVLLTSEHLTDVAYTVFWGGGWWSLPLLLGLVVVPRETRAAVRSLRDERVWLGAGVLIWQALYLSLMIPRLGPTNDIDLFFTSYLTLAFFAGLLIDRRDVPLTAGQRLVLVAGIVGASVATTLYLAWLGIPTRT